MTQDLEQELGLASIREARRRIQGIVTRTPLLRLQIDGPTEIWLKLENLQPVGSFKIRGAASALLAAHPDALARGVCTASAGNMAQGVAWMARLAEQQTVNPVGRARRTLRSKLSPPLLAGPALPQEARRARCLGLIVQQAL